MTISIESKFLGAMLGAALGDAVGALAARYPDKETLIRHVDASSCLNYTADTVMAVALAEHILDKRDVNTQGLGDKFLEHFRDKPWERQGAKAPQLYTIVKQERVGYIYAARRLFGGEGSFGNGAAMRVTPVGLFFHRSPGLYAKAQASAEVTHTHPVGIDGAAVFARALAMMVDANPQRPFSPHAFVEDLIGFARTDVIKRQLALVVELLEKQTDPEEAARQIGNRVIVQESMPLALFCFLHFPRSYLECLLDSILLGGKRQAMGAMVGAVSGAYLGLESISEVWRNKLEDNLHIETLARELAARAP
ncbi:MAG: ADP-ribosylglycohydrolase family protein [Gammaproteobacteria bacterium]|nr:ADP-ribosylglycohydrolase family protein [Gammaproteobacteria bacterium]